MMLRRETRAGGTKQKRKLAGARARPSALSLPVQEKFAVFASAPTVQTLSCDTPFIFDAMLIKTGSRRVALMIGKEKRHAA
jgi:hypothetical protein